MLHKNLIRSVIVLALSLLFIGVYSGIAEETSSRIYENVKYGAGRVKSSLGWSLDVETAYDADEIFDVSELVNKLANGETRFDWVDWLDLDKTTLFEARDLDPKLYPYLIQLKPHERPAMPYEVNSPPQQQAMIGRLYCKWYSTSPFRVVPLGDPRVPTGSENDSDEQGSGNVLLSGGLRTAPMVQYKVQHAKKELRHRQHGHTKPTEYYDASEPLVEDLKKGLDEIDHVDLLFPRLSEDLFTWNPSEIIHKDERRNDDSQNSPIDNKETNEKENNDNTNNDNANNADANNSNANTDDANNSNANNDNANNAKENNAMENNSKESNSKENNAKEKENKETDHKNKGEEDSSSPKSKGKPVEDHALTVEKALAEVKGSQKYFHEVSITEDDAGYGVHYDWRFFRGILPQKEHEAATHVLARAWQQFAEQMGIAYWYAHGSSSGYYWNGLTMPWDTDHDIQMPVQELNRLARDFNRTLVVQNTVEGYRKFLIDVSPYYVERKKGNGENLIDARFIDVDTGTYIDITGLARLSPSVRSVSCKNRHMYKLNSFNRIHRVNFEGYPALIPLNIEPTSKVEYSSYEDPDYKSWKFNYKVRLWEFTKSCSEYLKDFDNPRHVFCIPRDIKVKDNCEHEYATCDQLIIDEFRKTKDITELHAKEYEITKSSEKILDITNWDEHREQVDQLLELSGRYFKPFRNSTFFDVAPATTP